MSIKEIITTGQGTIIDVRNPFELAEGTIPGAVNIPVNEIAFRVSEIQQMKGPLVLYCRSGNRSGMAITLLRSAGVEQQMLNGGGYIDMLTHLN